MKWKNRSFTGEIPGVPDVRNVRNLRKAVLLEENGGTITDSSITFNLLEQRDDFNVNHWPTPDGMLLKHNPGVTHAS
ncbi:unnamed protein product [Merluccius merluccius]